MTFVRLVLLTHDNTTLHGVVLSYDCLWVTTFFTATTHRYSLLLSPTRLNPYYGTRRHLHGSHLVNGLTRGDDTHDGVTCLHDTHDFYTRQRRPTTTRTTTNDDFVRLTLLTHDYQRTLFLGRLLTTRLTTHYWTLFVRLFGRFSMDSFTTQKYHHKGPGNIPWQNHFSHSRVHCRSTMLSAHQHFPHYRQGTASHLINYLIQGHCLLPRTLGPKQFLRQFPGRFISQQVGVAITPSSFIGHSWVIPHIHFGRPHSIGGPIFGQAIFQGNNWAFFKARGPFLTIGNS